MWMISAPLCASLATMSTTSFAAGTRMIVSAWLILLIFSFKPGKSFSTASLQSMATRRAVSIAALCASISVAARQGMMLSLYSANSGVMSATGMMMQVPISAAAFTRATLTFELRLPAGISNRMGMGRSTVSGTFDANRPSASKVR